MSILVLDTCALLWLTLDPSNLSAKAHRAISNADALILSSISFWEVGVKWRAGRIELGVPYQEYVSRVLGCSDFEVVSVDAGLWSKSVLLNWKHRDPADRVIVALAHDRDASIVTADEEIIKFFKRCVF